MEGTYSKAFEPLGISDCANRRRRSTPIQIESPWLVQHLVEMHLVIDRIDERLEKIARKIGAD